MNNFYKCLHLFLISIGFKILDIRPKVMLYSLISEYNESNEYKRKQKIIKPLTLTLNTENISSKFCSIY